MYTTGIRKNAVILALAFSLAIPHASFGGDNDPRPEAPKKRFWNCKKLALLIGSTILTTTVAVLWDDVAKAGRNWAQQKGLWINPNPPQNPVVAIQPPAVPNAPVNPNPVVADNRNPNDDDQQKNPRNKVTSPAIKPPTDPKPMDPKPNVPDIPKIVVTIGSQKEDIFTKAKKVLEKKTLSGSPRYAAVTKEIETHWANFLKKEKITEATPFPSDRNLGDEFGKYLQSQVK